MVTSDNINLSKLGFDDWYIRESTADDNFEIARVTAVHKESCIITNGIWQSRAEVTGKIMFSAESPLDYPTVGDWCFVQYFGADSTAIIHEILPRKSNLKRKTAGKKVEFQPIASNIDTAFIVQSLDNDFSIRRLERYLVMTREGNINPVILLSKSDLMSEGERWEKISEIEETLPGIDVLAFSCEENFAIDKVQNLLNPGMTYCLLGSSGVGKTTLLNHLLGEYRFETKEVRAKDSKGRHTTTNRQLIMIEKGAMIIDTPGMRELGNISVESGIDVVFDEIAELEGQCKFSDCSHTLENECAILEAISEGSISEERFASFLKLRSESDHNERSYKERRDRDKKFGKLYKTVQKHNVKNQ